MRRRATTVDLADYGCEKALTNSSLNFQETLAALRAPPSHCNAYSVIEISVLPSTLKAASSKEGGPMNPRALLLKPYCSRGTPKK